MTVGAAVPELDGDTVGDGVPLAVMLGDRVPLAVILGVGLLLAVMEDVALPLAVMEDVGLLLAVMLAVFVPDPVSELDADALAVTEPLPVPLAVMEADMEAVAVTEGVTVPETELEALLLLLAVTEGEPLADALLDAVVETVGVPDRVPDSVGEGGGVTVAVHDDDAVMDGELVLVPVPAADGVPDGVPVHDAVPDGDTLALTDGVAVGVCVPLPLQVYLLRVIETHSVTRVGGTREIPIDVRVIAASNRDLQHAAATGVLRQDLYFRLLEFPLAIPPLRERREDIPLLAQHFLDELNAKHGTGKRLTPHAMSVLFNYHWPGNVRELLHTIRRHYITAGEASEVEIRQATDQPPRRRSSDAPKPTPHLGGIAPVSLPAPSALDGAIHFSVGMTFEEIEREVLLKTLVHFHNNKREAARVLGISLKTVYNKLLRYRSQGLIDEDVVGESENNGRAA